MQNISNTRIRSSRLTAFGLQTVIRTSSAALLFLLALFFAGTTDAFAKKKLGAEPDYTKGEKLPNRWKPVSDSNNLGPIGVSALIWARPDGNDPTHETRMLYVREIIENSPAVGKLQPSDVIMGVISPKIPPFRSYNWIPPTEEPPTASQYIDATLFPYDARKALGAAITEAEKNENGGNLVLNVWREGRTGPVALKLPVMGSFSRITPFQCEKTQNLVTQTADQIMERGLRDGGIQSALDALGLLATGEEKYINYLREWVRDVEKFDPKIEEIWRDGCAWTVGYELIFLSEYYLATKDDYILPTINRYAEIIIMGQSFPGTWSHGMATPELNYGRDHGITAAYGSMNSVTGSCTIALTLARKAGAKHPRLDKAIEKSSNFLAYFAGRGTVPYGDHTPWMNSNDSNGKNSQCAVLFDLLGQPEEAKYFSKMTLASHRYREQGHTGHYWSLIWGHIGAARAGDEAAHAFTKNMNWYHELERLPDNDYDFMAQLRHGHWKTPHWSTAGIRLLGLCVPRKAIYLTGKDGSSFEPITGDELVDVVEKGLEWPSAEDSTEELMADLRSWNPVVREFAAEALGKKDDNVVEELIAILTTSTDPNARRGAAMGLAHAGRGSEKAVDALIETLDTTDDQVLKHFVVRAFKGPRHGNGLGTSDAIAKAVPFLFKQATLKDPKDPWRKLHTEIASTLFNGNDAIAYDRRKDVPLHIESVSDELMITAMKSWINNVNGYARGWSSKLFPHLEDDVLEPLYRDIFMASILPSPSGVMAHMQVMQAGLELMAEKGFKEGAMVGAIQIRRPGWGEWRRVPNVATVLPAFGDLAEQFRDDVVYYVEYLINMEKENAKRRGELRPGDKQKIESFESIIASIDRDLPEKNLRSIEPFLKPGDLELAKILLEYYPTKKKPWNR